MQRAVLVALVLTAAPNALAASVSGTIQGGAPAAALAGIEVRLWTETPKGYVIGGSTTSTGSGAYTFVNVAPGNYKVDARMPYGMDGNWADRWYDRAPPTANGYVGEAADVLATTNADLGSIDITLESTGGFNGSTTLSGSPASNVQIRFENTADNRVHHNDVSQGDPHNSLFFLRGLEPGDYHLLAHYPDGSFGDVLLPGPFTVANGANTGLPNVDLSKAARTDMREPDNDTGVPDIDASMLHAATPQEIVYTDGYITPTADKDFYCFVAVQGDRLIFNARSTFLVPTRENPWVDPFLQVFTGDGTTKLFEDDDGGPGDRDSQVDTGIIASTGRICVVVSTFGGQTGGSYELHLKMGNRAPTLVVTSNGQPVPDAPAPMLVDEAAMLELTATYSDPEGGETLSVTTTDSGGTVLTDPVLTRNGNTATLTWTPSQTAARLSPYTVHFEVTDGEFVRSRDVVIDVAAVNVPPTTPVMVSPADKTSVNVDMPGLTVTNATDVDQDPLQYEFELTYNDATTPAQDQTVPEGAGGQTTFDPEVIPENTTVHWRVRAFDGNAQNGYSPWSMPQTFFVDVMNDPPTVPTIHKPMAADQEMTRRVSVSADNPTDPEGDAITLHFQVAKDQLFANIVVESPEVPMESTPAATTTGWTLTQDLDWGGSYYVRVRADDARGGQSDFSAAVPFTIKPDAIPAGLVFGGDFQAQCTNAVIHQAPPKEIELKGATDGDGESVGVELQIFEFGADTATATPLYDQTAQQDVGALAVFDLSTVAFQEDHHYLIRARAGDGTSWSDWVQCDMTLDQVAPNKAKGCGCQSGGEASLFGLLGLVALLRMRRARA